MAGDGHVDGRGRPLRGKALGLAELRAAGFPVPEFRCSPLDVAGAVRELGLPVAVRSSASVEDGGELSFAGQFRSFLNLGSVEAVEAAVAACHESLGMAGVEAYSRRHGVDAATMSMQVIVQRMVRPELAGVAFSVNPMTGVEEVVIEASAGVADGLLAGHEAPLAAGDVVLERYRGVIEGVVREIHRHFGVPQDVEFAVEGGVLWILQARPVTRIEFGEGSGEWTNADFRDGGVSSGVCTPLMWSLYDFIWEDALKGFLGELRLLRGGFEAGRMFFGRPYWNLGAVKECLARLPGYDEREFERDLSVARGEGGEWRRTPVTVGSVLRAIPTMVAGPRVMARQEAMVSGLLGGGYERMAGVFGEPWAEPERGLESLVTTLYRETETSYFRTIFCASLAKLLFMESYPGVDYSALVAGLPPLRHLEPTREIRRMQAEGRMDAGELMRRFGHRSRRELDLRVPRWDEDREWVEALLRSPAGPEPVDPALGQREALREALASLPGWRRGGFVRKLERLRRFLWLREEMRDLSSRVYHLIRRHVLAVGGVRGWGDDVFFMTWREVVAGDRSGVAEGRRVYESYRNFRAPNEIGVRYRRVAGRAVGDLRGIGASPGVVRGVARRVRTIEEALGVERGSVLVCPFTDPGWTPVLERVAAVVTETGGLLSHAAVICREYGIPAVLGVADAVERIPDGVEVTVDGSAGTVEIS